MPVSGWARQIARTLLSRVGYRLLRNEYLGIDPLADLVQLYGNQIKLIIDVGANKGQSATAFRTYFPVAEIHCFEPYPPAFEIARTQHAPDGHVHLYNRALGSQEATQTLFCHQDSPANSLLVDSANATDFAPAEWMYPTGTVTTEVRTLDQFCFEQKITAIDLLKIDTQGYELYVLDGAKRLLRERAITAIFIEMLFVPYYEGQAYFQDVYSLLTSYGYRLVGLYNQTRGETPPLYWCDGLFII